jgi:hypothetical protein
MLLLFSIYLSFILSVSVCHSYIHLHTSAWHKSEKSPPECACAYPSCLSFWFLITLLCLTVNCCACLSVYTIFLFAQQVWFPSFCMYVQCYINDLHFFTSLFTTMFADDTACADSDSELNTLIIRANTELKKIALLFRANKMMVNISKTKYINFHNKGKSIASPVSEIFLHVPVSSVHTCLFKPVTVHLSLSICLCLSGPVYCHVKLSPFICIFRLSLSISLYPSVSVHLSLYNVQVHLSLFTCLCPSVSFHLSLFIFVCPSVSVHLSLSICRCENNISRK